MQYPAQRITFCIFHGKSQKAVFMQNFIGYKVAEYIFEINPTFQKIYAKRLIFVIFDPK